MAIVIGLTGGIATGKSTVSQMFKSQNITVIDADVIAKEVCEINQSAYVKIVAEFGSEVIMSTGHLNRKKLANIVFNDESKLKKLNELVHPEVEKVIKNEIKKFTLLGEDYIVLDVPLLFESGFDKLCNITVVVFSDDQTQVTRLIKRDNLSCEEAKKRIGAQMDIKKKMCLADFKIDNSLSILETRKQFDLFMKKLRQNDFLIDN